jgi:hypothetical protein
MARDIEQQRIIDNKKYTGISPSSLVSRMQILTSLNLNWSFT